MGPLIILILTFLILLLISRIVKRESLTVSFTGRIAMAVMLVFTGTSHFLKTDEMVQMMPEFLPNKIQLVYFTGVAEIAGAVGLVFNRFVKVTSLCLIFFFLAILPANIIGSLKRVELGGMENGPGYLYFRIPLQLFFIAWTYYFGIYLFEKPLRKVSSTSKGNS